MEERFTFVLTLSLKKEIEKKAEALGMSTSTYVRSLIIADLKKESGC